MNDLVKKITNTLYNKKASDIVALDVQKMTVITDYMVIASGRSSLQVKNLADDLIDRLSEDGINPLRKDGESEARWIVLDYGHVLVHIFHYEDREFYRLDKLWEQEDNIIPLSFSED